MDLSGHRMENEEMVLPGVPANVEARGLGEALLRRLDNLPRRLASAALREARVAARRDPAGRETERTVVASVEADFSNSVLVPP